MHPAVPRSLRSAACVLVAVAALSACSSQELDVEGFAPGACTELAPALQDVDETLRQVGDEDIAAPEAGERFQAAQAPLKAAGASAQDPVATSVTDLVTSLGFFRIAVDSNNYDGSQDADVRTAIDALAEDCRTA